MSDGTLIAILIHCAEATVLRMVFVTYIYGI